MSETTNEQTGGNPRETLRQEAINQLEAIARFAEKWAGANPDLEEVFPKQGVVPNAARDEGEAPTWDEDQIAEALELATYLGYGTQENQPSNLAGGARVLDGGLAWKIDAEVEALAGEENPTAIIFAGSSQRPLREDELKFIKEKLIEGKGLALDPSELKTEYDFARQYALALAAVREEADLPYSYAITPQNEMIKDPAGEDAGRLKSLGQTEVGQDLWVVRVDREDYVNEKTGRAAYRNQPRAERLLSFVSDVLADRGDETSPVALVSSTAYASREPLVKIAQLNSDRDFGLAMYGRQSLAEVKGEEVQPVDLKQLPSELRSMHDNQIKLLDKLEKGRLVEK